MMPKELKILMLDEFAEDVIKVEDVLRDDKIKFSTIRVGTREEFVEALHIFKPDIVLSDHVLPRFNPVEALNLCKAKNPYTPFIMVTGGVQEEMASGYMIHGADDFVLKTNLLSLPLAI